VSAFSRVVWSFLCDFLRSDSAVISLGYNVLFCGIELVFRDEDGSVDDEEEEEMRWESRVDAS